jgi:hypothetical protein
MELVRSRRGAPGRPLPSEVLARAGWPDEALTPSQGKNRLRVGLSTLRRLGLEKVLETRAGGYVLAASCAVHVTDESPSPAS